MFDVDNATAKNARVHVDRILDGCILRENYEGADRTNGQSSSTYNGTRKVWHQSWVTNRGAMLVIEGKFDSGSIVLSDVDRAPTGEERRVRGEWKPVAVGVRETAVRSNRWRQNVDAVVRSDFPAAQAVSEQLLESDGRNRPELGS